MSNTMKRILTSAAMVAIAGAAAYFGLIRWLAVAVAIGMGIEVIKCIIQSKKKKLIFHTSYFIPYYLIFIASAYFIGAKPWIMLLLFITIAAADIGAWFFGSLIGGDKMWPSISAGKTWSGQIAGILCGTLTAVMYGLLGTDVFLASLMWIGLGVSLLSQYGDLAASAIKRKLGVKDYGNYLPGHGGLMDRFDGWIFVLPIVWLATMG